VTADGHAETRRDLVVNGLRVAVFERGDGEPCLLLHGYPQSHWCWRRIVPALADARRVIAVDWFGWGESERTARAAAPYDVEVERIGRLLDALGLDRVDLLAHDYGGFVGLGFAIRCPRRVARLAILNSRAHATFPPLPWFQFASLSWLARAPGAAWFFRRLPLYELHRRSFRAYVKNGSFSNDDLERYLGWLRAADGREWLGDFYRHYRVAVRAELGEGCRRLDVPAAVIWGDADPYCPFAIAEDLAARVPGARLTRVAGADHYVLEERPAEVAAALRNLLVTPARG
jgi:pimeloyl-ACP methyl ester carboxylesterase